MMTDKELFNLTRVPQLPLYYGLRIAGLDIPWVLNANISDGKNVVLLFVSRRSAQLAIEHVYSRGTFYGVDVKPDFLEVDSIRHESIPNLSPESFFKIVPEYGIFTWSCLGCKKTWEQRLLNLPIIDPRKTLNSTLTNMVEHELVSPNCTINPVFFRVEFSSIVMTPDDELMHTIAQRSIAEAEVFLRG